MAEKAAQLPGRIYSIQPSSDAATKDDPKGRTSWQVEPRATENRVLGAAPGGVLGPIKERSLVYDL